VVQSTAKSTGEVFTGGEGGRGPQWAVAICSGRGYLFQHKKRYQKVNFLYVLLKGTNSHGQAQIATTRTNSHGQGTYSHGLQGTPGGGGEESRLDITQNSANRK
jgi:hypothetical protein